MFQFFRKPKTVTFATSCYEGDWKKILLDKDYLKKRQIENHNFSFHKKILIINNVENVKLVKSWAQKRVDEKVLDEFFVAEESSQEVLRFFNLKREEFKADKSSFDDWVYFNALAPLTAIYLAKSDYLLYQTGDVFLEKKVNWIDKAIKVMEKNRDVKVANLLWNRASSEAKREAYRETFNFFVSKRGFSDQLFLVRSLEMKRPIYGEIREDATHFPRGDVFEKRVFSFMINHGWERITYKRGSYTHI